VNIFKYSLSYALLTVVCTLSVQAKGPNLVVILTDDQGYADVGFNGSPDILTPHIDTIATNGMRFTNGYVSFPVCGPSRAGLLTGRYQGRFGFTTNPTINPKEESAGIPVDEKNIAEVLGQVDYTSIIIGKWHMGTHPTHHPLNRGFDEFYGFLSGGHDYFPESLTLEDLSEVTEQWGWYRTKLMHNKTRVVINEYLTDELSNEAVSFVERHHDDENPFFLYLAYNAPHTPLQASQKYLDRFPNLTGKRKIYAAMLSAVDDGVGRLLAKIREHDIEGETLIFYLSDNGGATNNTAINAPLRAHKGSLYEGGIHVPFAAQWKGRLPAGVDYNSPVISLDILATVATLAEAPISEDRPLDGVNLIPYLTGENPGPPHTQLFWRKYNNMSRAIRQGNYKLVDTDGTTEFMELYDLAADIGERNLLAQREYATDDSKILIREQPDQIYEMMKAWEQWSRDLKPLAFPTLGGDVWW
jgi:arylsulfatase A-like enzyme